MPNSLSSRAATLTSSTRAATPMSRRVETIVFALLLGWIFAELWAQCWLVWRGTAIESVNVIFDDAYYYLGVAWNFANGHGSKFTEPLSTNGFHPLWMLMLSSVSAVFGLTKQGLVCAILVMTALVKVLGLSIAGVMGRDAVERTLARLAMFAAFGLFPFVFSRGLETTLFIVVIPLLLAAARPARWSDRRAWAIGLLASVMFLSRLDSLALLAGIFIVRGLLGLGHWRDWRWVVLPVAVTVAIYAAINLHYFGTPLPLSGQAKAIGSHFGLNIATALEFVPSLGWSAVLLAIWWIAKSRGAKSANHGFEIASLAIMTVISALYYGCMSSWPTWYWYQYPNAFLMIYSGLMAGSAVLSLNSASAGKANDSRVAKVLLTTALVIFFAGSFVGTLKSQSLVWRHVARSVFGMNAEQPNGINFQAKNVELVDWLAKRYPDGAMVAMGDRSGGLGYWLGDRYPMIQLEGLVGDLAFLKSRREGTVEQFLKNAQVSVYVVDRSQPLKANGVVGYVEPIQANFDDAPLTMFCFAEGSELLNQDYTQYGVTLWRRVYDFRQRIECPKPMVERARALQSKFGALREVSVL